jgi:pimeloyl-ACP methyl ester carboxylesterase
MPHQVTPRSCPLAFYFSSLLTFVLTVLIYDHRGIGNSSLSPTGDEEISIECLARDLLALLFHLKWKEVALCGYSMGGMFIEVLAPIPINGYSLN